MRILRYMLKCPGPSREIPCARHLLWHDNGQVETTTDLATTQRPLSIGVVSSTTGRAGATFSPLQNASVPSGARLVTVANPCQSCSGERSLPCKGSSFPLGDHRTCPERSEGSP